MSVKVDFDLHSRSANDPAIDRFIWPVERDGGDDFPPPADGVAPPLPPGATIPPTMNQNGVQPTPQPVRI